MEFTIFWKRQNHIVYFQDHMECNQFLLFFNPKLFSLLTYTTADVAFFPFLSC